MRHKGKTTERHVDELRRLRERIAELEKSEADRRRIEDELRSSKELLEKTFESQPDAIFVLGTGVPPKIIDCNPAAASMFGYARQELLGRTTQFLHVSEATLEQFQEQLYPAISHEAAFHFADFQMRRKDGEVFPTEHCVVPLKNEEGARVGWVSVVRDISNRKAREKALHESEERYRTLVETIPHGIQEIDLTGTITFANAAYEKIYGEAEGETIGKSVVDLQISDAARAELRDYLAKLVTEQPAPTPYMAKNLTRNGRIIDVQVDWNYRRDTQARVTGFISVVTDITTRKRAEEALRQAHTELERRVSERTAELKMANEKLKQEIVERKQAEEALRESEKRYRNIFENAVEGIFQATPEGRYLSVNPAWANMCGFSSPEEMIREVTDIANQLYVNPEDRTRIKRLYEDPGVVKGFEAQYRRKDGGLIWVSITARSVRDESGVLLYYEGTIQDITKRKLAEMKLEEYQERLRSLASEVSLTEERERRRLATDLHDSIGQTLAMCKVKLDELRSQASSAVLANDLNHVSTLLDQAIQGTRSLTFELSPPVLYELGIEAALESLVERMQQVNGTQIKLIDHGGPKPLSEDTAALCFRAVQELLVNAVKHAHARKIEVSTGSDRGRIRITVADDGIGFDTSGGISRKRGKGGFGLFSIRERLQHFGGSLKVDSKPGQGTRIILSAPLKDRPIRKG